MFPNKSKKKVFFFILITLNCLFVLKSIYNRHYLRVVTKQQDKELFKSRKKLYYVLDNECSPEVFRTAKVCSNALLKINDSQIKNNCNQCYTRNDENKIYYHTFWDLALVNSTRHEYQFRVLKLNLMSYLTTQNLCCSKLILWTLNEFTINYLNVKLSHSLFNVYLQNRTIQLRLFDIKVLCLNTISFKNHSICLNNKSNKITNNTSKNMINIVGFTDFVRFFVLDQYAGIWIDGDVILLRNLNLLWQFNFAYLWGRYKSVMNTAVLGITNNTNSKKDIYKIALKDTNNLRDLVNAFHPFILSKKIANLNKDSIFKFKSLKILRNYLFDPAWLCFEGYQKSLNEKMICDFKDFTNRKFLNKNEKFSINNFFPGSFAYHIHNDAGPEVEETSYFYLLEKYFENKLIK